MAPRMVQEKTRIRERRRDAASGWGTAEVTVVLKRMLPLRVFNRIARIPLK